MKYSRSTPSHVAACNDTSSQIRFDDFEKCNSRQRARHLIQQLCFMFALFAVAVIATAVPQLSGHGEAQAQSADIMGENRGVMTGFSGVTSVGKGAKKRDIIDIAGPSLQVFDFKYLGSSPKGQALDSPPLFSLTAEKIGQVFGVALDDGRSDDGTPIPPNMFVAATSAYGLRLVEGKGSSTKTIRRGRTGARFMPGQFGADELAGPGTVWRIDGISGEVTNFANIAYEGVANGGAALGNIAFDPQSRQLFVSDLATGMIHRLSMDGNDLGTFDHGQTARPSSGMDAVAFDSAKRASITSKSFDTQDPQTWGYTDKLRMLWGLAVHEGRLYYGTAYGPQIWSVGIGQDGSFANDAVLEINVEGTPENNVVTDIAFDSSGRIYVAQRGSALANGGFDTFAKPGSSIVRRYERIESEDGLLWQAEGNDYSIGFLDGNNLASGGIGLGPAYDGAGTASTSKCTGSLWATGDALRFNKSLASELQNGGDELVSGLQGTATNLTRAENTPPYKSYFIDYDGKKAETPRYGSVGDVEIFATCPDAVAEAPEPIFDDPGGELPPIPDPIPDEPPPEYDGPLLSVNKVCAPCPEGAECSCRIAVSNIGSIPLNQPVTVTDTLASLDGGAPISIALTELSPDGVDWSCAPNAPTNQTKCTLLADALPPGTTRHIDVTLEPGQAFLNCAKIDDHPQEYRDFAPQQSCTLGGPLLPIAGLPQLAIEKSCKPCVRGRFCPCIVKIKNIGDQPLTKPVKIEDELKDAGASKIYGFSGAGTQCTGSGTRKLACEIAADRIPPGAEYTIQTYIQHRSKFEACASLQPNPDEQRKDDPAEACVKAGDDLRITKTGPPNCRSFSNCIFDVRITNTATELFSGYASIADEMEISVSPFLGIGNPKKHTAFRVASVSPSTYCNAAGRTTPFRCFGQRLDLGPGQSTTFKMAMRIPIFPPNGGFTGSNCINFSKIGSKSTTALPDRSCATFSKAGIFPNALKSNAQPPKNCTKGRIRAGNGECVCPAKTEWRDGRCRRVKTKQCPSNMVRDKNGVCACAPGKRWNGSRCVSKPRPCRGDLIRYDDGKCACPIGERRIPGTFQCKLPTRKCTGGRYRDKYGACICPSHKPRWDGSQCRKRPTACIAMLTLHNGRCVCPGTLKPPVGKNLATMCSTPPVTCSGGRIKIGKACVCPPNKPRWDGKQCRKKVTACIAMLTLHNGRCVCPGTLKPPVGKNLATMCSNPPSTCSGGRIKVRGQCICPASKPKWNGYSCYKPNTCSGGRIKSHGKCVCPSSKPVWNGAVCTKPGIGKCTGGRIKLGKKCICPPHKPKWNGYQCTKKPKVKCSGGRIKLGNKCICPPHKPQWNGYQCTKKPKPTCTGGKIRVGKKCLCPPHKPKWQNGQCVGIFKPNPTPKPKPKPSCSGGRIKIGKKCICPPHKPKWKNGQCLGLFKKN